MRLSAGCPKAVHTTTQHTVVEGRCRACPTLMRAPTLDTERPKTRPDATGDLPSKPSEPKSPKAGSRSLFGAGVALWGTEA